MIKIEKQLQIDKIHLLNLSDNWDEEGNKGFLLKTIDIAYTLAMSIHKIFPDVEFMGLGAFTEGSIDVHFWKQGHPKHADLLFNVEETGMIAWSCDYYEKLDFGGHTNDIDEILKQFQIWKDGTQ